MAVPGREGRPQEGVGEHEECRPVMPPTVPGRRSRPLTAARR